MIDLTHSVSLALDHLVCCYCFLHDLYMFQRYMLGWRISRLGFVTPIVGEVSLGPLGNAHHLSLASNVISELVA